MVDDFCGVPIFIVFVVSFKSFYTRKCVDHAHMRECNVMAMNITFEGDLELFTKMKITGYTV